MKKKEKYTGSLIYGIHPVLELLKAKRRKIISIYTTRPEPKAWKEITKLLPQYPVAIQYVTRDVLHKLAGSPDHQSVVAWVKDFPFRKKNFDPQKQKFLVMLDGIQDPRNLGAIIRSAYCAGADGIVLVKKGAAPLNAPAIKGSAGLAEHMEIFIAPSIQSAVQQLKDAGYNLYMAVFGGQDAQKTDFTEPLCLVIGSEGVGISKDIIRYGTPITIAQRTPDISYNASVAAGILLFLIGSKNKHI